MDQGGIAEKVTRIEEIYRACLADFLVLQKKQNEILQSYTHALEARKIEIVKQKLNLHEAAS